MAEANVTYYVPGAKYVTLHRIDHADKDPGWVLWYSIPGVAEHVNRPLSLEDDLDHIVNRRDNVQVVSQIDERLGQRYAAVTPVALTGDWVAEWSLTEL